MKKEITITVDCDNSISFNDFLDKVMHELLKEQNNFPKYPKLVRDNIPNIIMKSGNAGSMTSFDYEKCDELAKDALRKKLYEEVLEYTKDENAEELADIIEVVYALTTYHGKSVEELHELRTEKALKNGKFKKKTVITEVREPKS